MDKEILELARPLSALRDPDAPRLVTAIAAALARTE